MKKRFVLFPSNFSGGLICFVVIKAGKPLSLHECYIGSGHEKKPSTTNKSCIPVSSEGELAKRASVYFCKSH